MADSGAASLREAYATGRRCSNMPAIIPCLGYNPLPEARSMAEQLVRHRTTLGLSQKEAAREIGVDQGTLARWERGERSGRHSIGAAERL